MIFFYSRLALEIQDFQCKHHQGNAQHMRLKVIGNIICFYRTYGTSLLFFFSICSRASFSSLDVAVCPEGIDIDNGRFSVTGAYRYNPDISQTSKLTYTCNAGFTLVGNPLLNCTQPDVSIPPTWDADPPRCQRGTNRFAKKKSQFLLIHKIKHDAVSYKIRAP